MGRTRRRRGRNRKGEISSTEEHATAAATQGTSSSSRTTVEQPVEAAAAPAPVAAVHSGAEPQLPAVYSSIDDEEEDSGVDELLDEYDERMLYEEPEELFESLKLPTTPSDGASGVWRDEVDGVARSKRIIAELQQEEEEQRCSTACGVMIAMLILYTVASNMMVIIFGSSSVWVALTPQRLLAQVLHAALGPTSPH